MASAAASILYFLPLDGLLEQVLLQAEVLDLKAATTGLAVGVVLESSIEKGRGPVATVLVKRGTLKTGDPIIAGQEFGRVRALFDALGKQVQTAGPAQPVQVLGLSDAPGAGDDLLVHGMWSHVLDAHPRPRGVHLLSGCTAPQCCSPSTAGVR